MQRQHGLHQKTPAIITGSPAGSSLRSLQDAPRIAAPAGPTSARLAEDQARANRTSQLGDDERIEVMRKLHREMMDEPVRPREQKQILYGATALEWLLVLAGVFLVGLFAGIQIGAAG